MKISDIVKVNINNLTERGFLVQGTNNPTAAVIVAINKAAGVDDKEWLDVNQLFKLYKEPDSTEVLEEGVVDTREIITEDIRALKRLAEVYFGNGGIGLIAKRIYSGEDSAIISRVQEAVNGNDASGQEALPRGVINIMLVNEEEVINIQALGVLAHNVKNAGNSDEEKMVLVNIPFSEVDKISNIDGVSDIDNLVVNMYNIKAADGKPATQNNYEVALIAAYVSKMDYANDTIKGLEYTVLNGDLDKINIMKDIPKTPEGGELPFRLNIITKLAGRRLLIGAQVTNGFTYVGKYFGIVLTQKITEVLANLTISKLNFENSTYSRISNALKTELDVFGNNGLFNTEFVSPEDHNVTLKTPAGEQVFNTVKSGDTLEAGYKVLTLPPTIEDLANKNYSGVLIYYAINNQIRTIHVGGIVLGGL